MRETLFAGAIARKAKLDALRFHELNRLRGTPHVALTSSVWDSFAFGLTDIKNVDGPGIVQVTRLTLHVSASSSQSIGRNIRARSLPTSGRE